ncbi:hypothetical protein [Infirmifilum sp.]
MSLGGDELEKILQEAKEPSGGLQRLKKGYVEVSINGRSRTVTEKLGRGG